MSEYENEVKTIDINYRCDTCLKGDMNYLCTSKISDQDPKYPHKCLSCGTILYLPKRYPYTIVRRIKI